MHTHETFGVYGYVSCNSCRPPCKRSPPLSAWRQCCVDLGSHPSPRWSPSSWCLCKPESPLATLSSLAGNESRIFHGDGDVGEHGTRSGGPARSPQLPRRRREAAELLATHDVRWVLFDHFRAMKDPAKLKTQMKPTSLLEGAPPAPHGTRTPRCGASPRSSRALPRRSPPWAGS